MDQVGNKLSIRPMFHTEVEQMNEIIKAAEAKADWIAACHPKRRPIMQHMVILGQAVYQLVTDQTKLAKIHWSLDFQRWCDKYAIEAGLRIPFKQAFGLK